VEWASLIVLNTVPILVSYQKYRTQMAILHQNHTDTAQQREGRRLYYPGRNLQRIMTFIYSLCCIPHINYSTILLCLPAEPMLVNLVLSSGGAHFPHIACTAGYVTPYSEKRTMDITKTITLPSHTEELQRVWWLTSDNPSSTRTATSNQTLVSAARGVRSVNTHVMTTPTPNTHFPPTFCASQPPGSWVTR